MATNRTTGTKPQDDAGKLLKFRVALEGDDAPSDLQILAYAFDRDDSLLASEPVRDGEVTLPLTFEQARGTKILFGPAIPLDRAGGEGPSLALLRKTGAYQPSYTLDPSRFGEPYDLKPIPRVDWKIWRWCLCRIRGQVVRPVTAGGATQNKAVCHARVHVCEVDRLPIFIKQLPDDIIRRLRDELLRELARPLPIPIPDPPPFLLDPGLFDPTLTNVVRHADARAWRAKARELSKAGRVAFNPQPDPPGDPVFRTPTEIAARRASPFVAQRATSRFDAVTLNPQPLPPKELASAGTVLAASSALSSLDPRVVAGLSSASLQIARETIVGNIEIVIPYLCLWPWFWWRFRCDEIAVVETDSSGRFDFTHWYICGDQPDLYFWIEYSIGGVWTTVYKPSIGCHTYWDYACGTGVTIVVTDPRVPACGDPVDLPGKQVAIVSVGENVSVHQIQQQTAGASEGLTTWGAPFGSTLELRAQFGRTALFSAAQPVTHYRWSYRRLTLSDGVTAASDVGGHHLSRAVFRHYMVIDPSPPFALSFPTEQMGPDPLFPGADLFKIQPFSPSVPSEGWALMDSHEDNATAFFETHLLAGGDAEAAAGKYELTLELFHADGTRANLTDEAIALKTADIDAPFGTGTVTTIPATAEHLVFDAGKVVGYRMVVRVDNNVCHGDIHDVTLNGAVAGSCGFLDYPAGQGATHSVLLSFLAMHPHEFATFAFDVARGSAGAVGVASASGNVGVGANGYAVDSAGNYSKSITVSTLLNDPPHSPPCTRGAFAEHLSVWAMATDGWYRLSALDAPRPGESGLAAFAVSPVA